LTHPPGAAPGGALPAETTSFVGRQDLLAAVEETFTRTRMVTLIGPGGVGKTRIALRAAAALADRHPDGVHFAELSSLVLYDPDLLPRTLAGVLGLSGQTGNDPVEQLVEHLAGRRVLIVLDTCEHLVDACARLVDVLLRAAPGLSVLATSRQPLDVPGEYTVTVCPLDPATDAVRLFEERAAAVVPGFRVTEADRPEVERLCRRLDGVPLAIELATVRLRALPLAQLTTLLEDRFRLLTGGRRAMLPRHQTLRTAIGWSHELCSPAERLLWARLSVFAGSFDVTAAEEVCSGGALPAEDVMETLIGLVDKSVVQCLHAPPYAGGPFAPEPVPSPIDGAGAGDDVLAPGSTGRYRLLDTLREFGADWLDRLGETVAVRARHRDRYQAQAEGFAADFAAGRHGEAYSRVLAEDAEHRAALDRSLEAARADPRADPREAARHALALWPYWYCSGQFGEARQWMRRTLETLGHALGGDSRETVRVTAVKGFFAALQGDRSAAAELFAGLPERAAALGDPLVTAETELFAGIALNTSGDLEGGQARLARARPVLTAAGDLVRLGLLEVHSAVAEALTGRAEAAVARMDALLEHMRPMPDPWWARCYAELARGFALATAGRLEEAEESARRALSARPDLRDSAHVAHCLELLALTAWGQGRVEPAGLLVGAADRVWELAGGCQVGRLKTIHELREAVLESVRESVGADRLDELRRRGARMTTRDAIAWATGETAVSPDVPLDVPLDVSLDPPVDMPLPGPWSAGLDGPGAWIPGPSAPAPGETGAGTGAGAGRRGLERGEAAAASAAAAAAAARSVPAASPAALTPRERQVAELVARGLSNRQVAAALVISKRTADAHVEHILAKLGVASRRDIAPVLGIGRPQGEPARGGPEPGEG